MRSMISTAPAGLLVGCVLLFTTAAGAAPAPAYAVLLREAQQTAPRLAEANAGVREAQGKADQARAIPNPTLGVVVENFGGQRPFRSFDQAETTFSLTQPLELGGKRGSRTGAARAEVTASEARARQARADFAYDLALAYALAEASDTRSRLATDAATRARDDLRIARALVEVGREANLRLVTAQAAEASTRAEAEAARADAIEALGRLSALAGTPQPYTSLSESLLAPPSGTVERTEPPSDMPAVQVAQAEREAARRLIDVERSRAVPDVTASLGWRRLAGNDATALVAGLAAPLPLFDRNRGNVVAASARASAAEARFNGVRLQAESDWRASQAQAAAAHTRVSASQESEAAAAEAYRIARIGYESGRTPLVEVLNAQRALTEAHLRTVEAQVARVRAAATLARLAGRAPFGVTE